MSKRHLTDDRKQECLRLKAIFNAKKGDLKLTQEKLAERLGINQSSVSHYLNAVNPLNASVAAEFARILEVSVSEFSPRLANEIDLMATASAEANRAFIAGRAMAHRDQGNVPREEYALIPQYKFEERFVKGRNDEHRGLTEGLVFRRDWLRKMNAGVAWLYVIFADTNDMAPYISRGDVVLFDTYHKTLEDKKVYVIRRRDGGLSIKRAIQQLSGSWIIRSDNEDKTLFPDEIVAEESVPNLPVIGKVIWRGGEVR
jgi:phage repressor protein C with HTH and peptisase S24 domain